jgi:hypothetical protein
MMLQPDTLIRFSGEWDEGEDELIGPERLR